MLCSYTDFECLGEILVEISVRGDVLVTVEVLHGVGSWDATDASAIAR